jgi:hypothetical protein
MIFPAIMEMWETEDDQYVSSLSCLVVWVPASSTSPFRTVLETNDDTITQLTSMLHAHEMKLLTQRNMFSEPIKHHIILSLREPIVHCFR